MDSQIRKQTKPLVQILFAVSLFAFSTGQLYGQIQTVWNGDKKLLTHPIKQELKRLNEKSSLTTTPQSTIQKLEQLLYGAGYLTAKVDFDSIPEKQITITPGPIFTWDKLVLRDFPKRLISQWGLEDSVLVGEVSPEKITQLIVETLQFHENNGYPFAKLKFDSISFLDHNAVSGVFLLDRGPYISIDSIALKGYDKIANAILRIELGIAIGMPYNEKQLQQLPEKIAVVEHLQMSRAPQVLFQEGKTTLFLYLEETKSNQFDGIVGINTREDGRVSFNGDFNLRLLNILKTGEDFSINWRSPDEAIQQIQFDLRLPYFLTLPIVVDVNFNLFRQDSSWSNRKFQGGVGYAIAAGTSISVGIQNQSSEVLSGNQDPSTGSVTQRSFYTQARLNKVNHNLLPTEGYRIDAKISQGTRQRPDARFRLVGIELELQHFLKLSKRSHFFSKGLMQSIRSDALLTNELYRIGGLKTLRGFNEMSFFSSTAVLGTFEYRFFLERFLYLFAFVDGGLVENTVADSEVGTLYPIGTGAGFSFRTGGGIFTLALAVGQTQGANFDFRTAKVHVGFVNRF